MNLCLQTLGRKLTLNEKFTAMHFLFSSKTVLWSRYFDSSRFCFKRLFISSAAPEKWQSSTQKVKVKKMQKKKVQKGPTRTSYWFQMSCQHFIQTFITSEALFHLVDPSTHVFPPHLCGGNCTVMTCSRMIRDICSCTCAKKKKKRRLSCFSSFRN